MAELHDMKLIMEPGRELSDEEIERYSRHLLIPEIGYLGQKRIINSRVLVVGAGGLGSPSIMYLAAAGVGTIGILDFDLVDVTNLQRQIIHNQEMIGKSKVESAKNSVSAINPYVDVIIYNLKLDSSNALEIFKNYDVIIDCTDNFSSRYLINDAAALLGKPVVWGSILQFDGQVSVFWSKIAPCYRCLNPTPPTSLVATCAEAGVLGTLCGYIGSIQSNEALKLITGVGETLLGQLLIFNGLNNETSIVKVKKSVSCHICNGSQNELLANYDEYCGVMNSITAEQLKGKSGYLLIDVREPDEHEALSIPGAVLIPKARFEDGSVFESLPKDKEIILHCRSGVRSANCLALLKEAGFSNSSHLEGGIIAWEESKV